MPSSLTVLLPPASGFSPCPPVSVSGTGPAQAIAAFLGGGSALFATSFSLRTRVRRGFRPRPAPCRRVPASSAAPGRRNLRLLPFGCAFRPLLRPRLSQGRRASPWKPRASGLEDSHLHLATHSGILPSYSSTAPSGRGFKGLKNAPLPMRCCASRGFGGVFQPRTFSARGLSASGLLRTL